MDVAGETEGGEAEEGTQGGEGGRAQTAARAVPSLDQEAAAVVMEGVWGDAQLDVSNSERG